MIDNHSASQDVLFLFSIRPTTSSDDSRLKQQKWEGD